MSNNNEGPLEPSRVAPDVHPANDGIIEDAQQGEWVRCVVAPKLTLRRRHVPRRRQRRDRAGGQGAVQGPGGWRCRVVWRGVRKSGGAHTAQVKGFAKVFAGETFNNPTEVEYGKQRLEGKEPDARLLDSEYADECKCASVHRAFRAALTPRSVKHKVEQEKANEPKVPFSQQVSVGLLDNELTARSRAGPTSSPARSSTTPQRCSTARPSSRASSPRWPC